VTTQKHFFVGGADLGGVRELVGVAPELRFIESDQTDPTGRFRVLVDGGDVSLQKALTANFATTTTLVHHKESATLANTAITGVLIGTPVTPVAPDANTLFLVNAVATGDVMIAANKGGTSYMAFMADASTGDTLVGVPTGQSFDVYIAGVKAVDIAAALMLYSGANSTANTTFTVENTSNAAAASHAIIEAAVGGTTSTGDPQYRLTIPGGTSWYVGVDNSSENDDLFIGTGTAVGTTGIIRLNPQTLNTNTGNAILGIVLDPPNRQVTTGAGYYIQSVLLDTRTVTIINTTQRTNLHSHFAVGALTIAQSAGAVIVDKATGHESISVTPGASVTLTHSSAYRALTGAATGTVSNLSSFYAEAQTAGTTGNYQVLMAVGTTEPPALADHVGFYAVDIAAGRTTLGISTEETVIATAELASTHKLVVRINGVSYGIMLTTTLT